MTITNPIRPDADAALRNASELARHPALRDVANVDAAATHLPMRSAQPRRWLSGSARQPVMPRGPARRPTS